MRRQTLPLQRLMSQESFTEVAHQLRYEDVSALYAAVGEGHVSTQSVLEKVTALISTTEDTSTGAIDIPAQGRSRIPREGDSGVLVRGAADILVKLAKCCTPVPGDDIVGFVTRGSGVSVHRSDCVNVKALSVEKDRMVDVEWAPTTRSVFLVQIQVEALDRHGFLWGSVLSVWRLLKCGHWHKPGYDPVPETGPAQWFGRQQKTSITSAAAADDPAGAETSDRGK